MLRAFLKKNMKLPELFEEKMRRLLGEDFSEYEKHLDDPAYYGIRVNTLKISVEDFLKICPFHVTKVLGQIMDFIMKEIKSLLNIRTTTPAFITFKSLLPCCLHRFYQ